MAEIPFGACVLSTLSGALIALEGAVLLRGTSEAGPFGGALLDAVGSIGPAVAILTGVLIVVLAFLLLIRPLSHRGIGIAILALSLGSFAAGGGFLIGAVAGVVGGILSLAFVPRSIPMPESPVHPSEADESFDDPVVEADRFDSGLDPVPPVEEPGPPT